MTKAELVTQHLCQNWHEQGYGNGCPGGFHGIDQGIYPQWRGGHT